MKHITSLFLLLLVAQNLPATTNEIPCIEIQNSVTNELSDVSAAESTDPQEEPAPTEEIKEPDTPPSEELAKQLAEFDTNPTTDKIALLLIQGISEKQAPLVQDHLINHIATRIDTLDASDSNSLRDLMQYACGIKTLETSAKIQVSKETLSWLFATPDRIRLFAGALAPQDNSATCFEIIDTLIKHDPEECDTYFNLIIALSIVWDTPRKPMHEQIGETWAQPDKNITDYYDYFKTLYASGKSLVDYSDLSIDTLIYVVDVPAPVSELEWALENITEKRTTWGRTYQTITYDMTRYLRARYVWPHHEYTLKEIKECYGICVDQAYYSTLSARAHGIPCIYQHGRGKFGGHAWFGFMKSASEWNLEVGRYSKQGYATGFCVHPQTEEEITDHDIKLICDRLIKPQAYSQANLFTELSRKLCDQKHEAAALICAHEARTIDPLSRDAWELETDLLNDNAPLEQVLSVLDQQKKSFRYYQDVTTEIHIREARYQREAGNFKEASRILRKEIQVAHSNRDDLQQKLAIARAKLFIAEGQIIEGLEVIEKIMNAQKKNGAKLFDLAKTYLELAKENDKKTHALLVLDRHPYLGHFRWDKE